MSSKRTVVNVITDGELVETTHNVTTLGGNVSELEMFFKHGVNPAYHITMDQNLKTQRTGIVNPSEATCPDTFGEDMYQRKIQYFCIGTGGINVENPITMAEPYGYETRLYNMVPFRCVPIENDLSPEDRAKYRIRRKETILGKDYYCYYLKKVIPEEMQLSLSNGYPYTPEYDHSDPIVEGSEGSHPMHAVSTEAYVNFQLHVSAEEFKEYYRAIHSGVLDNAKLTEFGLVVANEKSVTADGVTYDEVFNAELYSKVVHKPIYIDKVASNNTFDYTIYS